jgi:hypothetical protein
MRRHTFATSSRNVSKELPFYDPWGAHPDVMLILYKSLIRSVLEYAYDRMAGTHMLKFERVKYRCLRIVLGLMQSTHVETLEVIGGVSPLRMIFSMLNHGYLISAFCTAGHSF